ncbi:CRISPR-associated endoribonuclease Cas6 [Terrisporobacter sp.]
MRFSVIFEADNTPRYSNMQDVSVVKESLKLSNIDLLNNMYFDGNGKKIKNSKSFCSSRYIENYEMQEDVINIKEGGKVVLNFSSPDIDFMTDLYNGIMEKKNFNYKGFELKKKKIIMIKEKKIQENSAIFKTLSPIAIKSKYGKFMDIEDENYEKELNYIINKSLENYRGYGLKEYIKFIPLNMKKIVVKEEIEDFKNVSNKRLFCVNSYKGTFQLIGDKEDLNLIYKLGIGFRRNQSFGMVDLVE